jgi:5-(carboxyamino)imidazole ribonucleotide synthase
MLIGILGAGQLGRMLALAGYPLGLRFRLLDPKAGGPASAVAEQVVGDYDTHALALFAQGVDVVTYEFENVPVASTHLLGPNVPVYPPPKALAAAQDRMSEKTLFRQLGIPTASFASIDSSDELEAALADIGLPAVLKTRRFGYDGKGQAVLREQADAASAWQTLGAANLILEGFVSFERELSIVAARNRIGETVFYPLVENIHQDGILSRTLAPAPGLTSDLQATAESYATRVLDALNYVGVLAIELFQVGDTLLANEMAPRVHNSGHWTIEGAETSQFENHLRAVAGWTLGSTAPRGQSVMLNLIGSIPDTALVLRVPGAHLHLYDKAPRPGRKLGHITLRSDDPETLSTRLSMLESVLH